MIENSIYLSVGTVSLGLFLVLTDETFSIENQCYARLKEKSIWDELLFNQILITFDLKKLILGPLLLHTRSLSNVIGLELQIFTKIEMILKDNDIHSIELHTERVFVNLNSMY
jgi:hypothetical protein